MGEKFKREAPETPMEKAYFEQILPKAESKTLRTSESSEVEKETRELREAINEHAPDIEAMPLKGEWMDSDMTSEWQIRLSPEEYSELNPELDSFFQEVKFSNTATSTGFDVAAAYDAHVKGWTTVSKIVEVQGKKLFALCNYPSSRWRRLFDRTMEAFSGDPMRKPKTHEWKKIVETRSNIPTVAGTPENMVVMPFIESINAYDIFANQQDIKDFGPFPWAKELDVPDKIAMARDFAKTLQATHENGKTWGESILPNFILTKDRTPILIDAETTYEDISTTEQKATDVRNLISSISGALARSAGIDDFTPVVKSVLEGYPDADVRSELKRICSKPQPWRQRLIFSFFSRFRLGATSLGEFEQVKKTIVRVLEEK